jgi:hypothetical protein
MTRKIIGKKAVIKSGIFFLRTAGCAAYSLKSRRHKPAGTGFHQIIPYVPLSSHLYFVTLTLVFKRKTFIL